MNLAPTVTPCGTSTSKEVCVCLCLDRVFLCAHDLVQTGDTLNVIHACMPETYLSLSLSLI